MAEISSKDIGLYVNEGTDITPDWKLFACSTSDGFSGSTDTVTISNKCESGFVKNLPSDKSWEFSNSCYAEVTADLAAGQVSHATAFTLWKDGSQKTFKLANADDSYLRIGTGTITSYSESADSGDYLQFEITITGTGAIADVVA
jgi:predicted secreted protein